MLHVLKEKFHVYILCEYQEHSSVQRFTLTLFVKATFFSLTTIEVQIMSKMVFLKGMMVYSWELFSKTKYIIRITGTKLRHFYSRDIWKLVHHTKMSVFLLKFQKILVRFVEIFIHALLHTLKKIEISSEITKSNKFSWFDIKVDVLEV